jgi:glutathione S-transferase
MYMQLVSSLIGIFTAATEEEKTEKIANTLAALELLEGAFEKSSGGKMFFGGDFVGFVDVTLGSILAWIKAVERIFDVKLLDETKVPLLVQWVKHFLELEFVKSVLPSVEKVEEYVRHLQATRWKVTTAK